MKKCPKCGEEHNKNGAYCSRKCSNSRGPRTAEFKKIVSEKLKGRPTTKEAVLKALEKKGLTPIFTKPNTKCKICGNDTGTKYRKTCSDECKALWCRLLSQENPKCGGQKHTHRSKITNLKGEDFLAESSFEVRLSEIFNHLKLNWIRPKFLWYVDKKGSKRRYYPDFFLPDFDLYFDPKNDYLIKVDIDKVMRASKQNDVMIIILGEKHITIDSVRKLVGNEGNAPSLPACKTGALLLS